MIRSDQVPVGTTASLLAQASPVLNAPAGWFSVTSGTIAMYLGGPKVTSTNGAQVAANASLTGWLFGGDQLYAITASGSATAAVLQTGS